MARGREGFVFGRRTAEHLFKKALLTETLADAESPNQLRGLMIMVRTPEDGIPAMETIDSETKQKHGADCRLWYEDDNGECKLLEETVYVQNPVTSDIGGDKDVHAVPNSRGIYEVVIEECGQ